VKEGVGAVVEPGDSECMVLVRFGDVSKCFDLSVHCTSCDGLRCLVEKAFEKHLPASSPCLCLVLDGREVPAGVQSLVETGVTGLGLATQTMVVELIAKIDNGAGSGGLKQHFKSIPVEKLSHLIKVIHGLFEDWRKRESNPVYKERYKGDPLVGKEVVWDGFSDPVKYFFEQTGMDPSKDLSEFYSDEPRTIATSYVWKGTSLEQMAG